MLRDMETLYFHSLKIVVKIHRNYTIIVTSNANGFIYAHRIHHAAFLLIAALNRTASCHAANFLPIKTYLSKTLKKKNKKKQKKRNIHKPIPRSAMRRKRDICIYFP